MSERPLILVTNDDGFQAQGIHELTQVMCQLGEVVVMAPDGPRSGTACAITTISPVSLHTISHEPGIHIYTCSGTPSDCIKLALEQILKRRPALVVSGINHGDNTSISTQYSGTLGAVKEACMKEVPAIGFSLQTSDKECDFTPYRSTIYNIAKHVLKQGLPQDVFLNVNFPQVPKLQGVRICRTSRGRWVEKWIPQEQEGHFLLTGDFQNLEPHATDTDCWALNHGMAAITPLSLDATHYPSYPIFKVLES